MNGWYDQLAKPSWQPPPWAFSVAWTAIFVLKAIALWLVARRPFELPGVKLALVLFACQLVLNVGWSAIFFVAHAPAIALVEIAVLDGFVIMTVAAFGRVSHAAAALLVPYALWLVLATALNGWIAVHN